MRVTLHSRDDGKAPWVERWSGEVYRIVTDTERRESPPAHFAATTDRYWRLRIVNDPQLYRGTQLELGYRPARLRFLAQGGPVHARLWQPACGDCPGERLRRLLADVGAEERARMISEGSSVRRAHWAATMR